MKELNGRQKAYINQMLEQQAKDQKNKDTYHKMYHKPKYVGGGLGKLGRIEKQDYFYNHNHKVIALRKDMGNHSSVAFRQKVYNSLHNRPLFETGKIIINQLNK
jgi:hypothetical protein